MASHIFFDGHENCGCYRMWNSEEVYWFLPHSDAEHGEYPLHYTSYPVIMTQLREQLPRMRPGWIVKLDAEPLYGELRTYRR